MAKRAAPDEQPYRPLLDAGLVSAALSQATPKPGVSEVPEAPVPVRNAAKNLTGARPELLRRVEATSPVRLEESLTQESGNHPREIPKSTVDKFDHEKRILFTRAEKESIDRL